MSKIIVNIPDEFLKVVDETAKREHRTRSELLREAIRLFLRERKERPFPLRMDPEVIRALKVQDESRGKLHNLKFDSAEVIRKFRGKI
jgi:metal-responsive CopG/Arc/MetJ family transcriptional regulator